MYRNISNINISIDFLSFSVETREEKLSTRLEISTRNYVALFTLKLFVVAY